MLDQHFDRLSGSTLGSQEFLTPNMLRQAELAHVNRIITAGKLTAAITKEVNRPIAAMVMNAQAALHWLEVQPPNLEAVRQALATIIEIGRRANETIGALRAFTCTAPSSKRRINLNEVVLDAVALARCDAPRLGIALRIELAAALPLVEGDHVQLQQVILNLIRNAIEALTNIDDGPRDLLIRTDDDPALGVRVIVQDSGLGLDPESADRVFDAFCTSKAQGTGMGLTVCRAIVEAHGGRIWASAQAPVGAVFQFTLPVASA